MQGLHFSSATLSLSTRSFLPCIIVQRILCFNPFIYFFAIQLLMLSNPIVTSKSSLIHVWHCITDHILVPLYLGFRLSKLKRLRRRRRRRFSQLRDKVFKVFHLKKSEIRKAKEFEKMLQPKN